MSDLALAAVATWEYRDISLPPAQPPVLTPEVIEPLQQPPLPGLTEADVLERVQQALQTAEQRWTADADAKEAQRKAQIQATLDAFANERARYFQRVETEVVQLALAIARKILQREAELDPTLLRALVRIALDRMGAGPAVRLRLSPLKVPEWQKEIAVARSKYDFELVPDETIGTEDCIVETDLGAADFGLERQLKEVEQGLLDLLAHRPVVS